VTEARGVFWLYALLALLGATVTGLALFAAAASVRWDTPSVAALVAACRDFALPDVTTVSALAVVRPACDLPRSLIASAVVTLAAVGVVAVRVADASAQSPLNLPLFVANACMVAMVVVSLVLGATALLCSRRGLRFSLR
jgi:Mn2+/Fe2+ NRAMP family transporter